jgi:UDPglucose 6-dehydrogenase
MARIAVVGGGVVGSANGQGFASRGHEVTMFDSDPERVEALQRLGLKAALEVELAGPSSFVFLALPTPATPGAGYDLSSFGAGVAAVGTALRKASAPHVVVVRSTVPPGTTDGLVVQLLEQYSERKLGRDFAVAAVPEFLRSNSALGDFLSPWMTVIATRDPTTLAELEELFRPFGGRMHTFADPRVAEVIKLVHNAFNATKISFWNEMWQLCGALGLNTEDIATTVAYSAEASTNPLYGIRGGSPFTGSCLPKDIEGLLSVGRAMGLGLPLARSAKEVNEAIELLQSE